MISVRPIALVLPKALNLAAIKHQWYKSCPPHLVWLSCVWSQSAAQDLQRQCCGWEEMSLWHLQIFKCLRRWEDCSWLKNLKPDSAFPEHCCFEKPLFMANPFLPVLLKTIYLQYWYIYGLPPRQFLWAALMGMQWFKPAAGYSGIQNPEMTN